jgi:predicted nucleotidyltransferase component of viral defense system
MDITLSELKIIADTKGFQIQLVEKDYLLTKLLYLIKDVKGIYFKGGTALNKIFLNHARISEDLDFTLTKKISDVEKDIKQKLKGTIFNKITHDKRVEHFIRLIVHYKLFHENGTIFIDLNQKGKLLLKSEKHKIPHFYKEHIPEFSVNLLAKKEMVAEKLAATIGRNKPRDHFDIYTIINHNIPINLDIAKKKCVSSGCEFNILKMFNKAKILKNRWDEDIGQLLSEKVTFTEVMKTLAKHFKLKEEKTSKKFLVSQKSHDGFSGHKKEKFEKE